jgi:hypothetical protein
MAAAIPTTEPTKIVAGTTVQWTRTFTDYPASDYTLSYAIRGPSAIAVTVEADGDDYAAEISDAVTADALAGDYAWQAFCEAEDGSRYLVGSGMLEVVADLATISGRWEGRVQERVIADAILAVITGQATSQQMQIASVLMGEQQITRIQPARLREEYEVWNARALEAERRAGLIPRGGATVLARFTAA